MRLGSLVVLVASSLLVACALSSKPAGHAVSEAAGQTADAGKAGHNGHLADDPPKEDGSVSDSSAGDSGSSRDSGQVAVSDSGSDAAMTSGGGLTGNSVEFGRVIYQDKAVRMDAPKGGTLFSVWTKVPDAGPKKAADYPWKRGNMDVYLLYGSNWHIRFLVGNINAPSADRFFYNANSMLFIDGPGPGQPWISDYSYYAASQPRDKAFGWVWAAWLVVVENDAFSIKQWTKFGVDGDVIAADQSHPSINDIRAALQTADHGGWTANDANDWSPSDATHFQVGSDDASLFQARMMATNKTPTLAQLDAIARNTKADKTAWGDWQLMWTNGQPSLSDRSGHSRDLALGQDAVLYEGAPVPAL